jgi:hypothetical protein
LNPPANSAELLARERRLIKPAGYLALAGVVLFVISVVIQAGVSGENLDTDAGRLAQYGEDGGRLLLARVVYAIGWLCFILPLYVLYTATKARSDRVRNYIVAFCFIGPVLLAIQGPLQAAGLKDAGETFIETEPAAAVAEASGEEAPDEESSAEDSGAADAAAEQAETKPGEAGAEDPDAGAGAGGQEQQGGEVTTTPTEETTETTDDEEEDGPGNATEQRAEDLVSDSSVINTSQYLLLAALLGLVLALVYIPMQAMRTGLMTRFWATLGMALGVALVLLPFAQLALIVWFLALGILLLGWWPGGRPPAWDAGVAIPWTPRGKDASEDPRDSVEGRGRDVTGEEPEAPELPEAPGTDAPGPDAPGPDDPGAPPGGDDAGRNGSGGPEPRKRKRRH